MLRLFRQAARRCPSCKAPLQEEPEGIFKCNICNEAFLLEKTRGKNQSFVRIAPDPVKEEIKLKAEEKKYFRFFQNHRLEKSFLERKRDEWFGQQKDRCNYPGLIWAVSKELLEKYRKADDFFNMKMLYFELAFFEKSHNREFFHLLQESKRMELYDIRNESSADHEVIIRGGESDCNACLQLDGKKLTIGEALEKMPIPPKNCSHNGGWCTCCYTVKLTS